MKFIKEEESEREDYLLQDNKKTVFGIRFIVITLILLIVAVLVSIYVFEYF